jgi:uncharacterized membrane protein
MSHNWQETLVRWTEAGLVDQAKAARIRAWEAEHSGEEKKSRLALIAFGFGGLLMTAGVLLFVAAHWDRLAPGSRFALALAMIAVLHAAGAFAARSSAGLSATLHAAGTAALGAGIYLSGQIFHMAEHWPGALMLWSFGAAAGVWLLRQWPQVLWLAVLAPAWLWGEWIEAQPPFVAWRGMSPAAVGLFLFACVYLAASPAGSQARWRRALAWLGAVALIPAAFGLDAARGWGDFSLPEWEVPEIAPLALVIAWMLATMAPLVLAWFLRGRDAVWLLAALAWAIVVTMVPASSDAGELGLYALFAIGATGIVLWGMKDQQRLAINVGVLGFAVTVLVFYFSSVFDKLGRAFGLIGIGILFVGGGWLLERMRRRLVGRIAGSGT